MTSAQSLLVAFLGVVVVVMAAHGVDPLPAETKIVGGDEIDISSVPWQVSIQIDGHHHCGGVIVSELWVLSAAHCTAWFTPSEMKVRVGSSSWDRGGKVYRVEQVVNHDHFDEKTANNDISALKVSSLLEFGASVAAVTLPQPGATRPAEGTSVRVSGWGLTEGMKPTTTLRAVDIVVVDFAVCEEDNSEVDGDESTQVCAGLPGKNASKSDSGGPLVQGDLLVGIVSYGQPERRGVAYVDVTAYRTWIKNVTSV